MADIAELIVALKLRDGVSAGLGRLNGQLRGMSGGLNQVGTGIGQVGSGLSRLGAVAGVAAVGGLTAVVTTAASFEQAFTGVEKTVDGTERQLGELEDTLRQMARTSPVAFEELAGIAEAGGALGIARESIDEFTDVVARLAVSTDLSSEAAATSLGQLANVLQLGEADLQDFADSLVALGNAGASTESQIVEMAARFGAAGNLAGLTKEEILALSSAVASMGIEVEAGGTSLSRLFGNVATAIGTGSDEVEAFTDLLGISATEFKRQWSADALGTFQDFLEELGKLDQFAQARVLEQAGITSRRDINAVSLMAQNVGFLNDQLEISENATGALGRESDKFFGTTVAQWQILKNNVRDAAAVLGTDLLPVVNESMGALVAWLNEAGTQQGLKTFATDLAAGIRGLATELKGTDFSGIIGGIQIAASVAKGAFDAFRALPEPIQQLAIAALVANKVSGGAIGSIAAGLGNILLGSLKTITAANVTVIGANVTGGGGVPTPAGGPGRVASSALGVAKFILGPASAVIIGAEIAAAINAPVINPAKEFESGQIETVLASDDAARIIAAVHAIEEQQNTDDIAAQTALIASNIPFIGDALGHVGPVLEEQKAALLDQLEAMGVSRAQAEAILAAQNATAAAIHALEVKETQAEAGARARAAAAMVAAREQAARTDTLTEVARERLTTLAQRYSDVGAGTNAKLDTANARLATVASKNFSPTVNLTNVVNVSPTVLQQKIVQLRTITGTGFQPGVY